MSRIRNFLMLVFIAAPYFLYAQTASDSLAYFKEFDEFKKSSLKAFEAFDQQVTDDFNTFRDKANQDFSAFLKSSWSTFELFSGNPSYTRPKPPDKPVIPENSRKENVQLPADTSILPVKKDEATRDSVPGKPNINKGKGASRVEESNPQPVFAYDIDYFGLNIPVPSLPAGWPVWSNGGKEISQEMIAAHWDKAIATDHAVLLSYFEGLISKYQLNEWAVITLLDRYARRSFNAADDITFFKWFYCLQLGYDVRIALNYNLELIYNISPAVYGRPYFTIDNYRYVFLDAVNRGGNYRIYAKQHGIAKRPFTFDLSTPVLAFNGQGQDKVLAFFFKGKEYSFSLKYDGSFVRLYKDMPQCELDVYLSYAGGVSLDDQLKDQLLPVMNSLDEAGKVDFLLALVQRSFEYKTDDQQFGFEKWMVPHEILYYPYADCEDRTIFFIYLVRLLTDLDVVGVMWDDHAATAVHFRSYNSGTYIVDNGLKYYICDPTYMGASAGMCPVEYINRPAKVFH